MRGRHRRRRRRRRRSSSAAESRECRSSFGSHRSVGRRGVSPLDPLANFSVATHGPVEVASFESNCRRRRRRRRGAEKNARDRLLSPTKNSEPRRRRGRGHRSAFFRRDPSKSPTSSARARDTRKRACREAAPPRAVVRSRLHHLRRHQDRQTRRRCRVCCRARRLRLVDQPRPAVAKRCCLKNGEDARLQHRQQVAVEAPT